MPISGCLNAVLDQAVMALHFHGMTGPVVLRTPKYRTPYGWIHAAYHHRVAASKRFACLPSTTVPCNILPA